MHAKPTNVIFIVNVVINRLFFLGFSSFVSLLLGQALDTGTEGIVIVAITGDLSLQQKLLICQGVPTTATTTTTAAAAASPEVQALFDQSLVGGAADGFDFLLVLPLLLHQGLEGQVTALVCLSRGARFLLVGADGDFEVEEVIVVVIVLRLLRRHGYMGVLCVHEGGWMDGENEGE